MDEGPAKKTTTEAQSHRVKREKRGRNQKGREKTETWDP
jgi:hypothetical protein